MRAHPRSGPEAAARGCARSGAPQRIARFPNEGEPATPITEVLDPGSTPRTGDFTGRGAALRYDDPRIARWSDAPDLHVEGILHYGFAADLIAVARVDPVARTLTLASPHLYGVVATPFTHVRVLNLLEELDQPGEYVIEGSFLYFYPPSDPARALIEVSSMTTPLVALEGASHVELRHLTLQGGRGVGIYIERGVADRVERRTLRNFGLVAVQLGRATTPLQDGQHDGHGQLAPGQRWAPASREIGNYTEYLYSESAWNREAGTRHAILGCDIHDTGAGAVILGGMGRDPSEAGNVFRHNFFDDLDDPHPGGEPISAYFFDDDSVFGGTIYGNVFFRVGGAGALRFNGGGDSPLVNSIVVETAPPVGDPASLPADTDRVLAFLHTPLGRRRCFEAVDIASEPYAGRYPQLLALFAGQRLVTRPVDRLYDAGADLSQFIDPGAMNFGLVPGSTVYKEVPGFEPIPFDASGPHPAPP